MDQLPLGLRAPLTALQVAYPQPTNLPNVNVTALYPILENGFGRGEFDEDYGEYLNRVLPHFWKAIVSRTDNADVALHLAQEVFDTSLRRTLTPQKLAARPAYTHRPIVTGVYFKDPVADSAPGFGETD